jgi:translation initiation factor 1
VGNGGNARVVWVTGAGQIRYCGTCGKPEGECRCNERKRMGANSAPKDGFVRLALDRKQRRGKSVTLVSNVPGDLAQLSALAQELRRLCGAGGSLKDGAIELQGDHRDKVEARLVALGYKIKRVGG